jgi:dipeptidyl aminopeptidase/acylaminoacyl peptidase
MMFEKTTTRRILFSFFLIFYSSASAGLKAQEFTDPTLFGALPDTDDVIISPDGVTAAAIQTLNGKSLILFYNLNDPSTRPTGINAEGLNVRDIKWANSEYLLIRISQSATEQTRSGLEAFEFFRWQSYSKTTLKPKPIFRNEPGFFITSAGDFLAAPRGEKNTAIFSRTSTSGQGKASGPGRLKDKEIKPARSLFSVDLKTGRHQRIETGNKNTQDWIVDATGRAVARIDYDSHSSGLNVYVREPNSSSFKKTFYIEGEKGYGVDYSLRSLTKDGRYFVATSYGDAGRRSLVLINRETGKREGVIFENHEYDLLSLTYDARSATISRVLFSDDMPRAHQLDEKDQKIQSQLQKALPQAALSITSRSDNGERFIIEAAYTDRPKQFYYFDAPTRQLNFIAPAYNDLEGAAVAKKKRYTYQSLDGLTINGYLTVPANASGTKMPLIVLPHGGPETRSDMAFDWWSFFYAARGYLVYEPNFRGSSGYGYDFRAAGYGEWGRKMQDDISLGVEKLIADGIVDPDRICIVGASYGGYAALAGATLTPSLYSCAVSVNGVSILANMLGEAARNSGLSSDYWTVRIGNRFRDAKALDAVSPARIANKAGPPILLIHSKDDIVVPIGHSLNMRNALREANKAHEYVELDGEDHWLSTGATRTEMLQRSIVFIDRYIGE